MNEEKVALIPTAYETGWVSALERRLGNAVTPFNSVVTAWQAAFEVLGSREKAYPVMLPVTIQPEILSACIRAGCTPILMDIEEDTLQLDRSFIEDAITEFENGCVFVLDRPAGTAIDEELLRLTADSPRFVNHRYAAPKKEDQVGVFNFYDVSKFGDSGCLVFCNYSKQVQQLVAVRDSVLGLYARMTEPSAFCVLQGINSWAEDRAGAIKYYDQHLSPVLDHPTDAFIYLAKHEKAEIIVAHLHSYGIEASMGLFPAHLFESVHERLNPEDRPDYSNSEKLMKQVYALPTHAKVSPQKVVGIIKEITNA